MFLANALLLCVVVGMTDGDTLTARWAGTTELSAQTIKVRLVEIDAPGRDQPFGTQSREHLAALCFQQRAAVRRIAANGGLDHYGRAVARVACNGTDANTEQVPAGLAWYTTGASSTVRYTGFRKAPVPGVT